MDAWINIYAHMHVCIHLQLISIKWNHMYMCVYITFDIAAKVPEHPETRAFVSEQEFCGLKRLIRNAPNDCILIICGFSHLYKESIVKVTFHYSYIKYLIPQRLWIWYSHHPYYRSRGVLHVCWRESLRLEVANVFRTYSNSFHLMLPS